MEIFFLKKVHSKIWAAKFFPSPQSRRQVSANEYIYILHCICGWETHRWWRRFAI